MTKRITLALAMIGLSATAFAGSPGDNMVAPAPTGINLVAPDSVGTWSFGLEALYMEAGQQFQYAAVNTLDADDNFTQKNKSVGNEFDWGVEGDISYMFPGSSRDVTLGYTYMNFDDSNHVSGPANIGAFINFPDVDSDYDSAKAKSHQTLNQVDLTFGQLIRIGDRVDLHPFAGVRYADIDVKNDGDYTGTHVGSIDPYTDEIDNDSEFQGAGPRAGFDGSVHLGSGFSIVGTMAGSLLVGDMSQKFRFIDAEGVDVATYKNDSYTAIVPELDAKLGLDYNVAFNPNTSMDIQLGYQVVNYFNAASQDALDSVFVNSNNNTDDFNYQGPYLRLQLNVA